MANGKELRVIKNYYTLYDVTGLINKDKRLYYVPHKEELQVGIPVCESFINALNVVCPPPDADFVNVEISRWLPTDRELLVKGNIDIFTRGSSSHPLNYMIIKRVIINADETEEVFYNGYFINSATDTGINSVRLSVEPDDFTNVFYLHNTNLMTYSYEPFNDLIRNAYVQRQHYNRIGSFVDEFLTNSLPNPTLTADKMYAISKYLTPIDSSLDIINQAFRYYIVNVDGRKQYRGIGHKLKIFRIAGTGFIVIQIRDSDNVTLFEMRGATYSADSDNYICIEMLEDYTIVDGADNIHEVEINYSRDLLNLDLFSKIEDSYNYRVQYKAKREPLIIWKNITGGTLIQKIPSHPEITTDAQVKTYILQHLEEAVTIAQACVKYIHILTKDRITYPSVAKLTIDNEIKYALAYYSSDYESGKAIPSAQQHLVIPFISKVKGLEAFYNYFVKNGIHITANFDNSSPLSVMGMDIDTIGDADISNLIARLQDVYGYYIQTIYITPYSELSKCLSIEDFTETPLSPMQYRIRFNSRLYASENAFKSKARPNWLKFRGYTGISDKVDDYDTRVVDEPTMVFIGKNKPETEFPVGSFPSSIPDNNVVKGFYYGINYYLQKYYRGSIKGSEEFKEYPVNIFEGTGTTLISGEVSVDTLYETTNYADKILCPAFLVGTKGFDEVEFDIEEVVPLTYFTRDKGYEPVLEFEPYTYKTFSFLDVESEIQKKRLVYTFEYGQYTGSYVEAEFTMKLKYNQVVNAQFKFGLIPSYNINSEWFRYYPDTLLFTSANGMTIRNNSFYEYTYQQGALMNAERFLTTLKGATDITKAIIDSPFEVGAGVSGGAGGGVMGAVAGGSSALTRSAEGIINEVIDSKYNIYAKQIEQKAQLAGAGAKADTYTSAGSDLMYDLNNDEYFIYLNEYTIDDLSYKSVSKMLERYGYLVNIYDKLNVDDRCGWNYIKLTSFDFVEDSLKLSVAQEDSIRDIFQNGVTLMHNVSYINESKHNVEVDLKGE